MMPPGVMASIRRTSPLARALRHSKIAITTEIYTMVPDKATLAALKRLSDALSAPDAALPDDAESVPVAVRRCCT